jgi:glycosyltransferase involved in cell wall biosynthesis
MVSIAKLIGTVSQPPAASQRPMHPNRATPRSRQTPTLISVVVPVRDAEGALPEQLAALSAQTYGGNWEVVVAVDQESRDASLAVARRWAEAEPQARVVTAARGEGAGRVRNAGARAAGGDFIAFCDADDVVAADWLSAMAEAATHADLVAGRPEYELLNGPLPRSWHPDRPPDWPPTLHGYLPFAIGTNTGIWREVFEALGGFSESTVAAEDLDLSWRAQLASFTLIYCAEAIVHVRHRATLGDLARQYYTYGKGDAWLFAQFAPMGMPASGLGPSPARSWELLKGVRGLGSDATHRGRWVMLAALSAGHVVGSVRQRHLYR